jgi:transposase
MDLRGVGPVVAARVLADVGDVTRFADRNRFASWTGTAPLDASSGEHDRHRLSRAGNPPGQPRHPHRRGHPAPPEHRRPHLLPAQASRRQETPRSAAVPEAQDLRRHLRQLVADAAGVLADKDAGPGGHCGASLVSSATGSHPHTGTSDQPLPGPALTTLPAKVAPANPLPGSPPQTTRRRAGAVKVERPTGRTTLTATSAGAHSKEPIPAAISTANSASERAVPTCSTMWFRPPRRSAICTFVAPERPADFRMNTTQPTLPTPGVRQIAPAHAPDQHKHQQNRRSTLKWHE